MVSKIIEYQGQTYTYFQHYSNAGSDQGKSVMSLGTGVFEILLASMTSIKPAGAHLGVTNASIRIEWKDSGGTLRANRMKDGLLAIHHSVTLRNQIIVGPVDLVGWRMDYENVPTRFTVLYRKLIQ